MSSHAHVHDRGNSHDHAHGHDHAPTPVAPRPAAPAASLLRASLGGRLALAGGLIALIWLAVAWALR